MDYGIVVAIAALFVVVLVVSLSIYRDKEKTSKISDKSDEVQNVQSIRRISAASSLASTTVELVQSINKMEDMKFLCSSNVASADTVFFSCFVLRALCIMSTQNRSAAEEFSDAYISSIINMTHEEFMHDDDVPQMFDNRTEFYDKIIIRNGGITKGIPAVLEEFEHIIQSDFIDKKYVPYSESSPIPLIDFFDAMQCHAEINTFFQVLLSQTDAKVKQVMETIQ